MTMAATARTSLLALLSALALAAPAVADTPRNVDIPAGELSAALIQLSKQYGVDLFYRPEQVRGLRTDGAHGELTTEQAIALLIKGTSLKLSTDSTGAMVIGLPGSELPKTTAVTSGSGVGREVGAAGWTLAKADPSQSAQSAGSQGARVGDEQSTQPSGDSAEKLEEIVVTAQKRTERLQEVPVPVTSISASALVDSNQLRIRDYYKRVPGFKVAPTPAANNEEVLSIRGISTGYGTNPSVGVTIDDMPFGASIGSGGNTVPDIDPSDLARIEVLRGPQGTLYGASSMGGLLKFVTVDPSTERVSGRVQAGTASVTNGSKLGYNVRGSVNVPLGETLAVRASGFTREDPGYIDNPVTGVEGLNKMDVSGGNLAALWRPSDTFSLKLTALYQDTHSNGLGYVYVLPTLGDLEQNDGLRGVAQYDRTIQAYGAIATAKLGRVDLTSVTGYNTNEFKNASDRSVTYGTFTQTNFGVTGAVLATPGKIEKFTQELRLSLPITQRIEWLLGAFYAHEDNQALQDLFGVNPVTGAVAGTSLHAETPRLYKEYAAFMDFTVHFTDRFDVQVGGRESRINQEFSQTITGLPPLVPGNLLLTPQRDSTTNVFTYLVTPRLRLSPNLMVYARAASGYRPGVPNISVQTAVPPTSLPDKTHNFEIGLKSELFDRMLSIDASVYHIDWKDIQLLLVNPVNRFSYQTNGSRAKSEGVELTVEARPWTGMTASLWVAFSNAVLTEDIPLSNSAFGISGDRLPNSSRRSGTLSLEQGFNITADATGFVAGSISYVGDAKGVFTQTALRQNFDSYTVADLSAGVRRGAWSANLFVNNIADERGVIGGGIGTFPTFAFTFIQPRTVGAQIGYTF